jgi:hypothetical protein
LGDEKRVPTLVLSPRYSSDSIALGYAAALRRWSVVRLQKWSEAPSELRHGDVAVYGEQLFAEAVSEQLGVVLLEPTLDWLCGLPRDMVRREIRFMTLSEARKVAGRAFFKPADEKCFERGVYASGREVPASEHLPPGTPVLVQEAVSWSLEARAFVADRKVLAMSFYLRNGELNLAAGDTWPSSRAELRGASDFLSRLLDEPGLPVPPAAAIDVGIIEGRGWAVVEANAAWASGIYGCEAGAALECVARACVPRNRLARGDKDWIVSRGD